MKKIALLFLIYLIPLFASSQTLTSAQAINKSGRQIAISQRIAKDYLMILAGIKTEEATKDLEEYSSIFNENIQDLSIYCKTKGTQDLLTNISEIWRQLRLEITEAPSTNEAVKVIEDANTLLVLSNFLTEKIVAESNLKTGKLVNIDRKSVV